LILWLSVDPEEAPTYLTFSFSLSSIDCLFLIGITARLWRRDRGQAWDTLHSYNTGLSTVRRLKRVGL